MPDRDQRKIVFNDLGLIPYNRAWEQQELLFRSTINLKIANRDLPADEQQLTPNYFLFCEHPPVITIGKSGEERNLLLNETGLAAKDIQFLKVNRGGDITCHNPGQVVGYPILDLDHFFTDIHKYLRLLEETIILTLAEYGIESGRLPGATGVWIDADKPSKARKICAMGVRSSRWVTMHGFALNVNNDLDLFKYIIPCGISDKGVTSVEKELGRKVDMDEVKTRIKLQFVALFDAVATVQSTSTMSH